MLNLSSMKSESETTNFVCDRLLTVSFKDRKDGKLKTSQDRQVCQSLASAVCVKS